MSSQSRPPLAAVALVPPAVHVTSSRSPSLAGRFSTATLNGFELKSPAPSCIVNSFTWPLKLESNGLTRRRMNETSPSDSVEIDTG